MQLENVKRISLNVYKNNIFIIKSNLYNILKHTIIVFHDYMLKETIF